MRDDTFEGDFFQDFTFEELKEHVREQWEAMSSEERHMRVRESNPTYAEYVLSLISAGESVAIDELNYDHRITVSNSLQGA